MWICCGIQLSCLAVTQTSLFLFADTWRNSAQSSVPCLCSTNVLSTGPIRVSIGTLLTSVAADLSAVGMAPLTTVLTFTAPNMMRPQGSALKEMSKLLKAVSYLTWWKVQPALTEENSSIQLLKSCRRAYQECGKSCDSSQSQGFISKFCALE